MPLSPLDPTAGCSRTEQLDLLLAITIVEGGWRGPQLMQLREARDHGWIIGALGCRGVHVTPADVDASVHGSAGRFMPGQVEFELVRGLRRVIDHIDDAADLGITPSGRLLVAAFDLLTRGIPGFAGNRFRAGPPWDLVPHLTYPGVQVLEQLLRGFDAENCYLEDRQSFRRLHPVGQAARLFAALVRISPFRDYNLLMASLAAAWFLLAKGYPPFRPQAGDRQTMRQVLTGDPDDLREWFAEVVLVGYRAMGVSQRQRWS